MANRNNPLLPIAVVGSGHFGMASIIRTLIEISQYDVAAGEYVDLLVFNTGEQAVAPDTAYPLRISVDALHPFASDRPPADFPAFGDYVRAMRQEDPGLRAALERPLFGHVTQYLEFMMELAIIAAGEKVSMEAVKTGVREIWERAPGGHATIVTSHGARIDVSRIVRNESRPHLPVTSSAEPLSRQAGIDDAQTDLYALGLRARDCAICSLGTIEEMEPVRMQLVDHPPRTHTDSHELASEPYIEVERTTSGLFTGRFVDPPRFGPPIPYGDLLSRQVPFLDLLCRKGPLASARVLQCLLEITRSAVTQMGSAYVRGLILRLHAHRWLPGAYVCAILLIEVAGGREALQTRARDEDYLKPRYNDVMHKIKDARFYSADLTEWTERLYLLDPLVLEVAAHLQISGLARAKEWHDAMARVHEDIQGVHRLNAQTLMHRYLRKVTAPTWTSTYLTHLRTGKSEAEYGAALHRLCEERVTVPQYWRDRALALHEAPEESIPGALDRVDPYRVASIEALETWSLYWKDACGLKTGA